MSRCCLVLFTCVGCLILSACNSPKTIAAKNAQLTSLPDGETASPLANTTTSPIHAALDKAQSITAQTAQTAQSAISAAQSTSSQVSNTVQSASAPLRGTLALQTSLQSMLAGISATLTAVKSGDLTTAQQEFLKVQGDWARVGEVAKTQSATLYQQVDRQLDAVSIVLNTPNPDRDKLMTELTTLGKILAGIPRVR